MTAEELLKAVSEAPMERLKWRVLCHFGILPGSKRARELSDIDYIICGAHMALDAMPRHGSTGGEGAQNSAFDSRRFEELSEGKV